ncbi:MAG: mechanosensitive ion channel protein MscS [Epsilonproteobacteria bacterium]|nr:mechanosensitive ion channel protein MscS [Campylobacterota bacterium]NPA88816.1 mechanosensitive ion channel family protein [Campylobacterota bacterium]
MWQKVEGILNYPIFHATVKQWLIGTLVLLSFIFLRRFFTRTILGSLQKLTEKTKTTVDDKLFNSIRGPFRFFFIILGFFFFFAIVGYLNTFTYAIIRSLVIFDLTWLFYNLTIHFEENIYNMLGKFGKTSKELTSFVIKVIRGLVIILGGVAILQELGINVSGFIASLGLGGLAFALAAKDTAANIFGGIAILTDNIFRIGEWVKVKDVEGIVEDIGIRTTKIRAFDHRLIIVPNSIIANSNVENFSRRDRRRVVMRLGLTYSTSRHTMELILNDIRKYLENHPFIHKEPLLVYFDEFQDSSLSIFCYFFITTADWQKYLQIKEEINLKLKDIVEERGAEFAFPSQSLYIETPVEIVEGGEKIELKGYKEGES